MKKVLMLGAGPLQVPAIQCLRRLGCYTVCVDYDSHAPGLCLANQYETISTIDMDGVLSLARSLRPDYVITSTTDAPVRTAAYVSEKMGLFSGITYDDAICATYKDAMRDRLREHGVPIPRYVSCEDASTLIEAIDFFQGDCVVKPADSAASRGVVLLNSIPSRHEARDLFNRVIRYSRKGTLMVEERMRGPEVSVESLTINGSTHILAITDKLTTKPPYCVELGHSEQSQFPESVKREIGRIACLAIDAIGIRTGPAHTEIMVTSDGPKVVEIAARLGGDYITSKLVPLSTGIDLVAASVMAAVELPVDIDYRYDRGAAIRFITCESGTISSLEVDPAIYAIDGFEEVELYKTVSDEISSPHSSNDRVGHVICSGRNAEDACIAADTALSMVHLAVQRASSASGDGRQTWGAACS